MPADNLTFAKEHHHTKDAGQEDKHDQHREGYLPPRDGGLTLDLARLPIDHKVVDFVAVAVGGKPDRQQNVLEGDVLETRLDPQVPVRVSGDLLRARRLQAIL